MSAIERVTGAADRFQQRWPVLAFPVAVWKKFNDDQAGNLAALIAYYGFAAIFPLLLLLVTVLNIVLKNNASLRDNLLDSALSQYPVVGPQIKKSIGTIPGTGLPLIISIVFLVLGARGVAGAMQNALCQVWGIPKDKRPGFPMQQVWSLTLVFFVGIGFLVTTFVSGVAGGAGHLLTGVGATIGAVAISLVLNVGVFWLAFRIATVHLIPWRNLWFGAAIAAVTWTILQLAGGYIVSHQLHRASEEYGTFGVVLGLLAWLYLQAELTLYAAEIDTVVTHKLWPRSVLDPKPALKPDQAPDSASAPGSDQATGSGQAPDSDEAPVPPQRAQSPASDKKAGTLP